MTAQHTPGPWVCEAAYGNHGLRLDSAAGGALGHVRAFIPSGEIRHGMPVQERWEEGFANARLIAAAPELLDELMKVEKFLLGISATDYPVSDELFSVQAVIAKATGSAS